MDKMDFFEVGDKTSLICADPVTTEIAKKTLRELEFKFHTAEDVELAIDRIKYTRYNCIIVHENFAGGSLRSNAVLNYLSPLPMALRRFSFVCLVGQSFKTLDAMQAFAQSVHLVMNTSDMHHFTPILRKGLMEFDILYRVYKEALASASER